MKNLISVLLAGVILGLLPTATFAGSEVDKTFTKEIADVLKQCETIKPGMTRADLSKLFTTEGGLYTAKHRTYVYRRCPYIKIDVDFSLSETNQGSLGERPTDIITKISKPYLDWSVTW